MYPVGVQHRLLDQADYIEQERGPLSLRYTAGLLREGAEAIRLLQSRVAELIEEIEECKTEGTP